MPNPTLVSTPFANTGTKNDIPDSGATQPQLATMQAGFPAITQVKISEGGIPPERADFNGILNLYGQHVVHLNKGLPYEYDATFASQIGGYPLHARIMLNNGDIVQCTTANNTNDPNVNMSGWKDQKNINASNVKDESGLTQQEINNTRFVTLSSVADFNGTEILNGVVYQTKSYIVNTNYGSCSYKYDETIAKNKHNGGTIIDPSIVFTTLEDFLSQKSTSGLGCFVALNINNEIPVEIFGARPIASFTKNDVPINAAITVASARSNQEPSKVVTIGSGEYLTEKAVINTSLWHIIPPHIRGAGRELTKIVKTTNTQLGGGYLADSTADAVLVSSPRSDNVEGDKGYLISEKVTGLSVKHQSEVTGSIGWLRHRSAMGYVDDFYSSFHETHFIFNDCWMTNFGQMWCNGGKYGYVFNVATSLLGGQLYATSVRDRAFLFDKVIYSDLNCCADYCGDAGDSGATAYKFVDCKAVSGKFNAENHRGELFSFNGSYGLSISGQDWRARAVATTVSVPRIYASYAVVSFDGYEFLEAAAALTTAQLKNYEFILRDSVSSVNFVACAFPQQHFGATDRNPLLFYVAGKFNSNVNLSTFIQYGKTVQNTLGLTTSFQQLCYAWDSGRIKINSANSADKNQPYFVYVDNEINRTVGIKVSSISQNSSTPTDLATIYTDDDKNPTYSTKLQGYIDAQGWLNVKAAGTGFNLNYNFNISL